LELTDGKIGMIGNTLGLGSVGSRKIMDNWYLLGYGYVLEIGRYG